LGVTGQSTLANVSAGNLTVSGTGTIAGTVTAGNLSTAGSLNAGASTLASANVTGNLNAGNIASGGTLSAVGATTVAGNLTVAGNTTVTGLTSNGAVSVTGDVNATGGVVASKVGIQTGSGSVDVLTFNSETSTVTVASVVDVTNAKVNSISTTPNTVGSVASDVQTLTASNATTAFLDFFRKLFGSN
jgi:hypothetical protein